jgi:NADPH:quinone reductase-like Zn-dependent oxidoreductase
MRAVQITRFGGPEVLDVVDPPDPVPGPGQQLYDVSTAGVNYADTHHRESRDAVHARFQVDDIGGPRSPMFPARCSRQAPRSGQVKAIVRTLRSLPGD